VPHRQLQGVNALQGQVALRGRGRTRLSGWILITSSANEDVGLVRTATMMRVAIAGGLSCDARSAGSTTETVTKVGGKFYNLTPSPFMCQSKGVHQRGAEEHFRRSGPSPSRARHRPVPADSPSRGPARPPPLWDEQTPRDRTPRT
jgi:hypothetical protein